MMKVTENNSRDTVFIFTKRIEGFTYEEGYKYALKVLVTQLKNPPADGHSETYKLLNIISKEKAN